MSAYGPQAFGIQTDEQGLVTPESAPADRSAEARLALLVLGTALACIYAVSGATLVARLPLVGAVLIGVAALQMAWIVTKSGRLAATLNALLVAVWAITRVRGLQPVGVLDTMCAVDAAVIVLLAVAQTSTPRLPITPALSQCAVVLAVASLSALAGGHTHSATASAAGSSTGAHALYCRLV